MTTATGHRPRSIIDLLDAPLEGGATFRPRSTVAPWESPPSAPAPAAESELLTVGAASKVVPLSIKQLYRVAERSDGPFRKVEGRLMAYADDLHRWIREHPTGSKPDTASAASTGDSLADRVRRRREGSAS